MEKTEADKIKIIDGLIESWEGYRAGQEEALFFIQNRIAETEQKIKKLMEERDKLEEIVEADSMGHPNDYDINRF